jgi:predicted Rossmann-fold nucleotide-binding protein
VSDRTIPIIAIFGANAPNDDAVKAAAKFLGQTIGQRRCILLTGGENKNSGNIKDLAIVGANNANSQGYLAPWISVPQNRSRRPDQEDRTLLMDLGLQKHQRNILEAHLCDGAIALPGKDGTISEVGLCLALKRPVVFVGWGPNTKRLPQNWTSILATTKRRVQERSDRITNTQRWINDAYKAASAAPPNYEMQGQQPHVPTDLQTAAAVVDILLTTIEGRPGNYPQIYDGHGYSDTDQHRRYRKQFDLFIEYLESQDFTKRAQPRTRLVTTSPEVGSNLTERAQPQTNDVTPLPEVGSNLTQRAQPQTNDVTPLPEIGSNLTQRAQPQTNDVTPLPEIGSNLTQRAQPQTNDVTALPEIDFWRTPRGVDQKAQIRERELSGWRVNLLIRANVACTNLKRAEELESETHQLESKSKQLVGEAAPVQSLVEKSLRSAIKATKRQRRWKGAWSGADIDQAWQSLHEAEASLILFTTDGQLESVRTRVLAIAAPLLSESDPRIIKLRSTDAAEAAFLSDTLRRASAVSDAQHIRARKFRNILLSSIIVFALFAVLTVFVASYHPAVFGLCEGSSFSQPKCVSGGSSASWQDVLYVEFLGLFAAAVTGAIAIRRMRGSTQPYAINLASLGLKLPIGALTAVGGLLLIHAGFISVLTNPSRAQLVAYALVFGASQQLFTGVIDRQAQSVLNSITGN